MKTLLFFAGATLSLNALAQTSGSDFRTYNWGASLEQVQGGEQATLILKDKDDRLLYKDVLGGYDCDVTYTFNENDKLIGGNYVFTKKYTNPELYLQDYKNFKALLLQKYGKPKNQLESWNRATQPDEQLNYGHAIANANLSLNTIWETARSTVQICLSNVNGQPMLQIHYTAKSLDELENKEVMQSALTKL